MRANYALVSADAALGALTRYAMGSTLTANIVGCFLLGLLYAFPPEVFLVLGVGFCCAFTTFSTTTIAAISLLRDRRYLAAATLTCGALALCLAACAAGLVIHTP